MNRHAHRALSARERETLEALIVRGATDEMTITATDRTRWLEQAGDAWAGAPCTCGACTSIELTDSNGNTPTEAETRVVLTMHAPGAMLLLFIDDDRLSYLELAPTDPEGRFTEFPARDTLEV